MNRPERTHDLFAEEFRLPEIVRFDHFSSFRWPNGRGLLVRITPRHKRKIRSVIASLHDIPCVIQIAYRICTDGLVDNNRQILPELLSYFELSELINPSRRKHFIHLVLNTLLLMLDQLYMPPFHQIKTELDNQIALTVRS